jgi:hypothetical protein
VLRIGTQRVQRGGTKERTGESKRTYVATVVKTINVHGGTMPCCGENNKRTRGYKSSARGENNKRTEDYDNPKRSYRILQQS